jgi:hypothetical protein
MNNVDPAPGSIWNYFNPTEGAGWLDAASAVLSAIYLSRTVGAKLGDVRSVRDYGAVGNDVTDDLAVINSAISSISSSGGGALYFPKSSVAYKISSNIILKSDVKLIGEPGTVIKQYGQYAIGQTPATALARAGVHQIKFQYAGPGNARDCAAYFRAHQYCTLHDLEFSGYDNCGIVIRKADVGGVGNTVFNSYQRWNVPVMCLWFEWAQGLDSNYVEYTGNGVTTAFAIPWNFSWPSDITTGLWKADGTPLPRTLNTDFTVTGGGGAGAAAPGTLTFTSAPAANDLIMIWPRNALNRLSPISGNVWDQITVRKVRKFFHLAARYVDSERYRSTFCQLAANNARCFYTNPFSLGNGECDIYALEAPTLVYSPAAGDVVDPTTVRALDLGPGTERFYAAPIISDREWPGGKVEVRDTAAVTLTGTVTVANGSPIVTGAGTKFTEEVTLFGGTSDRIIVNDKERAITSIDSDTQITCATNWEAAEAGAGLTAMKANPANNVSYEIVDGNPGGGVSSRISRFRRKSGSFACSVVTFPGDVTTSMTVRWGRLHRAPLLQEIRLTAGAERTFRVGAIGTSAFTIHMSAASASPINCGWCIDLVNYNDSGVIEPGGDV